MSFGDLLRDRVTLVKKDGSISRDEIKAQVSSQKIIIFDSDLVIEPGDHFLRKLPSGLVEDFVIDDPNFIAGLHSIPDSYQCMVSRTDQHTATQQKTVQNITAHFHGANSRITVGSDRSINLAKEIDALALEQFIEQIKGHISSFSASQRAQLEPKLELLESEIRTVKPDPGRLRDTLKSIGAVVAEGAAGNLVAEGILAAVTRLMAS